MSPRGSYESFGELKIKYLFRPSIRKCFLVISKMNLCKIISYCLRLIAREWFKFEKEWQEIMESKICERSGFELDSESEDWEIERRLTDII